MFVLHVFCVCFGLCGVCFVVCCMCLYCCLLVCLLCLCIWRLLCRVWYVFAVLHAGVLDVCLCLSVPPLLFLLLPCLLHVRLFSGRLLLLVLCLRLASVFCFFRDVVLRVWRRCYCCVWSVLVLLLNGMFGA